MKLQGFTNADWAGSPSDRKSTSGGIFYVGSTVISWYSRKQRSISLSSMEIRYMEASQATCVDIYIRKIRVGLFGQYMDLMMIDCDNQSFINSRLIQYSMTGPNILISNITISDIVFRGGLCH